MKFPRLAAGGSLAHRFGLGAAALAAVAMLLTALSSWWLIKQQRDVALHEMQLRDADYNAAQVKTAVHAIFARIGEVADSSIIASGLVDSAGKETYLTPYLNGIRRINGIPIQLLFTDFEGVEIASNGIGIFGPQHIAWIKERLDRGNNAAAIVPGDHGDEVIAVELLRYSRTKTPEGALVYKFTLADIKPQGNVQLLWGKGPTPKPEGALALPIDVPQIFQPLNLRIIKPPEPRNRLNLTPQYGVIIVFAAILAIGVLVLGSRLAWSLTRDLRRLDAFSRSVIVQGFSKQRANEEGSQEVAGLARSINHMLDRLYDQHARLHEESLKLQQLANTIPQLAWMSEPDGTASWVNDRWYDYTGTNVEDVRKNGWKNVISPETYSQIAALWKKAVELKEPFHQIIPLRGKDGRYRRFLTLVSPLLDASGNVVQWFGTNTDLTPIEEAEKAVHESEERLREGLKAGRMVAWDWHLASGNITMSDNAAEVFGRSIESADDLWSVIHPDDTHGMRDLVEQAIRRHGTFENEIRMLREDGSMVWVEVRGSVVCDAEGNPTMVRGISLDVTERKHAEEELRVADRRKDEFLAMLAHELRNPLAPITTAASILNMVNANDPRVSKMSEIIARQAAHMKKLLDDLLDVSRVTRGLASIERQPVNVADIAADAVEQVRALAQEKHHQLSLHGLDTTVKVMGDRTRLVQVIANLLNNAIRYTPDGGHIELDIHTKADDVVITVRDNGSGISPTLLPHIFDLFIQGERSPDRAQGGLGLGLALVKSLVNLHGGTVAGRSAGINRGTEFEVRLPIAHIGEATIMPQEVEASADKPLQILVVDDNVDAAQSLALLLETAGNVVQLAYNAEQAMDIVRQKNFDACLLDIGLPGTDGYELARQMRRLDNTKATKLIALTGYGNPQDRERSMQAGFDHHLLKPVELSALTEVMRNADRSAARNGQALPASS